NGSAEQSSQKDKGLSITKRIIYGAASGFARCVTELQLLLETASLRITGVSILLRKRRRKKLALMTMSVVVAMCWTSVQLPLLFLVKEI
ncbi:hypothetical protein KOI40_17270, partial [Aestuariicella sp. G3-2]|uniref:hypothetical protein n=1 Tax=Pseudomaricurvus albidus TaxID=2842452 RepID=UPI001C0E3E0B